MGQWLKTAAWSKSWPAGPISSLWEQLVVLVSTAKSKEAIGVQLTHEAVKRLTDKEVEKYSKRYKPYVGSTASSFSPPGPLEWL